MARRSAVPAVLAIAACLGAHAQGVPQAPEVTLKSNPRLVIVDVVVTDSKGQSVTGLTREDFTVLEDRKPQRITSFEAHTVASQDPVLIPAKATPQLGPNEYTNTPIATPRVVNIVLLDTLNTSVLDQSTARRQMLLFLKRLPPGERLALFTLGTDLRMIQGVTGTSDTLVATIERLSFSKPMNIKTDGERNDDFELVSTVQGVDPKLARGLAEFLEENEAKMTDIRVAATLEALQQIARAVAGYPGRKNLIWLSGGFPIVFLPGDQLGRSFGESTGDVRIYSERLRKTAAELSSAEVAIYPVDVRGLVPFVAPVEISGRRAGTFATLNRGANFDVHQAMDDLATQTGGKAFYNANDLDGALARSFAMGSSYYTLAYTPPSEKWDGNFRQIQVKLARKGLKLAYRRGYFAVPDDAKRDDKQLERAIETAMLPVSIDATALLFKASVPPRGADGKVEVHYIVPAGQIPTRDAENRPRELHIDFVVTAWDAKGQNTGAVAKTVIIPATKSEALAQIEQGGLTKLETLTVKPGTTRLRVGIMDRNTGKIGTVEVPL